METDSDDEFYGGALIKDKSILNILSNKIIIKRYTKYKVKQIFEKPKDIILAHVLDAQNIYTEKNLLESINEYISNLEYILCMNGESAVPPFVNKRHKKQTTVFKNTSIPIIIYLKIKNINVYKEMPELTENIIINIDKSNALCYMVLGRYVFCIKNDTNVSIDKVKYIKNDNNKLSSVVVNNKFELKSVDNYTPIELPTLNKFLQEEFNYTTNMNIT